MIFDPHAYQAHARKHLFDNPFAGLFMDMGMGKTAITLTHIDDVVYGEMDVSKVLIIAPKKVAEVVWTDERDKWDHTRHLRTSVVLGNVNERLAALKVKADIYIINRENVQWLVTHYASAWPFDMVIFDESSSFKNPSSQRFKAIRMILPKVKRRIILTGTPSPNGLPDLWAQLYLLDMGERLGKTITYYRNEFLKPLKMKGHIVYKYGVKDDQTKQLIYDKIGDLCISMKAKDYLDLPERKDILYKVKLSKEMMKRYEEFEETEVLTLLEEGQGEISAPNRAALIGKLLQFANGAIYMPEINIDGKLVKEWVHIHDEKLDALEEIIEAANGEPVLVFYQYKHDLERIQKRFGGKKYEGKKDFDAWNRGEIPLLLAHPASVAYGLNMQAGGCIIVWFGPTYNLELVQQGIARLDRQGQLKPVMNYTLACPDTEDISAVIAIENKTGMQEALLEAVKAKVEKVKAKYHLNY